MSKQVDTIAIAKLDAVTGGQNVDYRLLPRWEIMKRRNEAKYGAQNVDRGSLGRATSNPNVTPNVVYPYQFDRPVM